ncbi:MAG: 4Fe-4S dicluster domain-containing protein [Chloroflexi bacterium]|nr:4Fe-4S dicluster domain-containing protein [Chloroflexota bacterium]
MSRFFKLLLAYFMTSSQNLLQAITEKPGPHPLIMAAPGLHANSSFPSKCRHCSPAPCMAVCPTGAIGRDSSLSGIVVIDGRRCIACAMCAVVCPFDVITYHVSHMTGLNRPIAVKCDNCIDRQRRGRIPACVEACKVRALEFGDINELVKKGRTRLAKSASIALGQIQPEESRLPANVGEWRHWGEAVGRINHGQKKEAK